MPLVRERPADQVRTMVSEGLRRSQLAVEGHTASGASTAGGPWLRNRTELDLAEWQEVLSEAYEGAERVRQIVFQLKKAFSGPDEERLSPVDVHQMLDSVVMMAARQTLKRTVSILPRPHIERLRRPPAHTP